MDEDEDADRRRREALVDRAAVELIAGRRLVDEPWPAAALRLGTRVRVVQDPHWGGPWAREFLGVIDDTSNPDLIVHPKAGVGEFSYSVRFDEHELDLGGDGPYRKARIWGRYLHPLESSLRAESG